MDLKKIEILIDKYYDGKTSIQEENELINFFSYNDVPEYLQAEASFFKGLNSLKTETMPKRTLVLNTKKQNKAKVYRLYASISVAATIALAIGITLFLNDNKAGVNTHNEDNIVMVKNSVESADKEAAYQETKKALLLVSTKLNIGMKEMGRLSEFDKSQQKIKKGRNNKNDTK